MSIDKKLVRYSWFKESLNKDYEYVRAVYSYRNVYASDPANVSLLGMYTKKNMFDFCRSISRIPTNKTYTKLDLNFVKKYSFFKFSASYYLEYCWDYIDDILCDKLDGYKFSVYYDDNEDCIYLMDNIKVMDVLVHSETIETTIDKGTSCKADIEIGFAIEEAKNKEEIINNLVEILSEFREEDVIYSYLNESDYASISFNSYMPSSSYEVRFKDEIVGTDLIEAVRKKYEYWKNKYENFEEAVRKALNIKEGINVKIDYDILYASGVKFNMDPNENTYWYDIDFAKVEDDVLSEKTSERNFEEQLDMDRIKTILEEYEDELEGAEVSIYQSKNNNKIMYVVKQDEIYRIPAFILFHALSMQGFYCDTEIHSFIDTLIDADEILELYNTKNYFDCEYLDFNDLELVVGNGNLKMEKVVKNLYSDLEDVATFIKYDSNNRSKIKVAIKTTFFEDLWIYRDRIVEIVTEKTKVNSIKDVTLAFYVSTYETMEDIETNSMYPFSDKRIYVDEKLAKSSCMYLYAEIILQQ